MLPSLESKNAHFELKTYFNITNVSAVAILVMGIVTVINNSKKLKTGPFIGTITVFYG